MRTLQAVVTDIEGTTSAIAFVRDVLFPYARSALPAFIAAHHARADVSPWLKRVAEETGLDANDLDALIETLQTWIDIDKKHTALKALQGMIWVDGYTQGVYQAPVYPDAAEALNTWQAQGLELYVYSSGSVPAQKLFFAHTDHGNLCPLFSGHFDTEIGGKRDRESYQAIAAAIGHAPDRILFLSDIVQELDAARDAGWHTVLVDRVQDYPETREQQANGHARVTAFTDVSLP